MDESNVVVPELIFIVPYRDREAHKHFFTIYMKHILEDIPPSKYEIIFSFQDNNLPFNRGGMKNLGFLYAKKKYPNHYTDITFIFHDVDTVPYKKGLLNYDTTSGTIKHFYGYQWALGGILSITGHDFEMLNGFPNYWGWGFEDNELHRRALRHKLTINRDQFYTIKSNLILHFYDEFIKKISRTQLEQEVSKNVTDGLDTLEEINQYWNDEANMLYNTSFSCEFNPVDLYNNHEVGSGIKVILPRNNRRIKRSSSKGNRSRNAVYSFLNKF